MNKPTKHVKTALQGKISYLATMVLEHLSSQKTRGSRLFVVIQLMHQCERSSVSELHKYHIDMESGR